MLKPEESDFRIIINDRKQGFVMYKHIPIAQVGYTDSDCDKSKHGWYYMLTNHSVIRPHKNLEEIFTEIFRLVDTYSFEHFHCQFFLRFSPRETANGYDSYTYINGELECARMKPTVFVGTEICEQIDDDVKYAKRDLWSNARKMLEKDVKDLSDLIVEIKSSLSDHTFIYFDERYKDIEAINDKIAKNIANIRGCLFDIKY